MFFIIFSNCQSMLPATGAPVSRHRTSKIKEMFDEYVRTRTRENWKFWIVSFLDYTIIHSSFSPLLFVYNIKQFSPRNIISSHSLTVYKQFSILLEPLMVSFNTSVSTASIEDLYRSTMLWVEQHCSLVDLRPGKEDKLMKS